MNIIRKSIIALSAMLMLSTTVLAQRSDDDGAACAGCGVCGGSMVVFVLVPIVILALNIAILVWVARDAKARGMDSAVLWMVLVFFTGFIGLLIYVLSRPQGNIIRCSSCGNNRLQASAKCPHCGNA
jgi:hypothetical protein